MIAKILSTEEEIELIRIEEREEGREQGCEEGKLDMQIKMIRTMYAKGMSSVDISKFTNIALEEVNKYIDKMEL